MTKADTSVSSPIGRLLAIALRLVIDDLHASLAAQGWHDVKESYGFVLLAVRDQPGTVTELANVLGVSKQAVSKLLDGMEAAGYVIRTETGHDGRARNVTLAARGKRLMTAVEAIYEDIEAEWASVIGQTAFDQTRGRIERVIRARNEGQLPSIRATALT